MTDPTPLPSPWDARAAWQAVRPGAPLPVVLGLELDARAVSFLPAAPPRVEGRLTTADQPAGLPTALHPVDPGPFDAWLDALAAHLPPAVESALRPAWSSLSGTVRGRLHPDVQLDARLHWRGASGAPALLERLSAAGLPPVGTRDPVGACVPFAGGFVGFRGGTVHAHVGAGAARWGGDYPGLRAHLEARGG